MHTLSAIDTFNSIRCVCTAYDPEYLSDRFIIHIIHIIIVSLIQLLELHI